MLFRQIEYFQAVIETGNFYQAAEKCFPISYFPTDKKTGEGTWGKTS